MEKDMNTVHYDKENKQILTPQCRKCPELSFQPVHQVLPHVGCCSYSPIFTLFEIHTMITAKQQDFFLEEIYHNPQNTIRPFEVIIHAHIHPLFSQVDNSTLSATNYEDKKLAYSVCQFFILEQGCSLTAQFKTSICRSFICSSVEEKLDESLLQKLSLWNQKIQGEAREFNQKHKQILQQRGWQLGENTLDILAYLRDVTKTSQDR